MTELASSLAPDYTPYVLPMAASGLEKISKDLESLYCSGDPEQAWKTRTQDTPAPAFPCVGVPEHVVNALGLALFVDEEMGDGASSSVAVIAPNGAYYVGGLKTSNPAVDLREWIKVNDNGL